MLSNLGAFAAEKYPAPRGAVNDFANVIDQASSAKMEALAREVLQKTGTAVVVVTVPTIGEGEEISLYVNGLYKAWGIGKKGEDKGVLIFLTIKERKIRIETGYGVEGILPDGLVGEIRDTYLKPQLQAGNYGKAFYDTMYACSSYIAKSAEESPNFKVKLSREEEKRLLRLIYTEVKEKKKERLGIFNPVLTGTMLFLKKTIPDFSASDIAGKYVMEGVLRDYPDIFEKVKKELEKSG